MQIRYKGLRDACVDIWNKKQLDKLVDVYAADAILIPSDGQRVVGRADIRNYFQKIWIQEL